MSKWYWLSLAGLLCGVLAGSLHENGYIAAFYGFSVIGGLILSIVAHQADKTDNSGNDFDKFAY